MKKTRELFRDSSREMKNVRSITMTAMLVAVWLVLDKFSILIAPSVHLKFTFVAQAMIGVLFGPVVGMGTGAATEALAYMLYPKPGGYFPGFGISALINGLIYGIVLYKKPITLKNAFLVRGLIDLFVNTILNTYWLSVLYGDAFAVLLPARALKNALLWPVESIVLYITIKSVQKAYQRIKQH